MANETSQQVQQTQPELTVERTNYGWKVQLPKDPRDEITVNYEAQRFSVKPYGIIRLMKTIDIPTPHYSGYFFEYEQYEKIGDSWTSVLGGARAICIIGRKGNPNPSVEQAVKNHLGEIFEPDSLEARAFEMLLGAN